MGIVYLGALTSLFAFEIMTLKNILFAMIFQGAIATIAIYWVLRDDQVHLSDNDATLQQIILEYWVYCKPLILLALITFLYDFADKWMLQKYGGSTQQGFFQIANQFAGAVLLATSSILSIYWKEIADAWAKLDYARISRLYRKATRGLVMLSAIVAGLVLPWSEQVVVVLLGSTYAQAWPVLAIMLLYPIHLPMGIIGGSTLLAIGQTKKHTLICVAGMLVSLPFAYLMLAPITGGGWAMGAWGLALKLLSMNVISTNIQAWIIARHSGWKFDWLFQVVGIPLMIALGFFVKFLMGLAWNLNDINVIKLLAPVALTCFLYTFFAIWAIWLFPWLVGLERKEIKNMLTSSVGRIKLALIRKR
jgi:O-antigen/teichoic acid export membrane protein